ncbi:hypothetical protein KCU71_g10680, partial [Aureobasidium melanogenum]
MKTSTIILSLLSSIAIVAAVPVSHPTRTSEDSVIVLTGTRLSPITTTFGTVVRRTAPYEPTHSSEKDCPYVCNNACWFEGGCTPEAFSKWQSELAADAKSSWDSILLEHWSSTHIEPKPTEDAEGMSISWRTIEPSPVTTTISAVVKRSDGIRDPHWFSGPTNVAELDCENVCSWGCLSEGSCSDEAISRWHEEEAASYSSAWSSRFQAHYDSTHVAAKPTADADGMSISWKTIEPSPVTTTASTVVKRSDGIRDPHWFSGPTNIAQLDCPNVCNWACFYHGGCTDEAYQEWLDEDSRSYSLAWSSRLMSHYNATHVPAKPTADASGMSVSWRTIYPNSTGLA